MGRDKKIFLYIFYAKTEEIGRHIKCTNFFSTRGTNMEASGATAKCAFPLTQAPSRIFFQKGKQKKVEKKPELKPTTPPSWASLVSCLRPRARYKMRISSVESTSDMHGYEMKFFPPPLPFITWYTFLSPSWVKLAWDEDKRVYYQGRNKVWKLALVVNTQNWVKCSSQIRSHKTHSLSQKWKTFIFPG